MSPSRCRAANLSAVSKAPSLGIARRSRCPEPGVIGRPHEAGLPGGRILRGPVPQTWPGLHRRGDDQAAGCACAAGV